MEPTTSKKVREIYKPPPVEDYSRNYCKLTLVIIISFFFISAELTGGILSGSIAIISDAFHLVTDFIGFILSFAFIHLSRRKPTAKISFGFHRMELVGALANLFIIWLLAVIMIIQATDRIVNKIYVKKPFFMLVFAIAAFCINVIMYFILHGGSEHSHGLMSEPHQHGLNDDDSGIDYYEDLLGEDQIKGRKTHKSIHEAGENHNHEGQSHDGHSHDHHDHQGHHHDDHDDGHDHGDHDGHDHHDHDGHHHDDQDGHDHSSHSHSHQSIGMKAALLHALSDVIQSIGIVISATIIYFLGSNHSNEVFQWNDWHYCDPIATYIFSILATISTFPIVKNCYDLLMEATPAVIDTDELREEFEKIDGVIDVHDLHIWDLRPGKTIMMAHIMSRKGTERQVLTNLTDIIRRRKIYHSTFQVEQQDKKDHRDYIACHHDIH